MQRIVLDTNVLVSALIRQSYPYLILNELLFEKKISLCISEALWEEYYEVLKRDKFSKYPDFIAKAESLLVHIEHHSEKFFPKGKITLIRDVDDNKFLEISFASKANFLITGNTNDFTMKKYKTTKIVTPKEYWENYRTV